MLIENAQNKLPHGSVPRGMAAVLSSACDIVSADAPGVLPHQVQVLFRNLTFMK